MSTSRQSLCTWVVEHYHERLTEVVRRTESEAVEHGFSVTGTPEDHSPTGIIRGSASSIDVTSPTTTEYRPVRVEVHSHPTNNIVPSDRDWRSFLTGIAQYGADADFPDGWQRGMVIVSRRLGEEDTFGLRGIELTEAGALRSPAVQRQWVDKAFDALDDPLVGGLGSSQSVADAMGPEVRVCTMTVEDEHEGGYDA